MAPVSTSVVRFTSAVLLGAVLVACGPNLRNVAEGQGEWERCYALDRDPETSPDDRANCWSGWQQNYSAGQSPDRTQYAQTRLNEMRNPAAASARGGSPASGGSAVASAQTGPAAGFTAAPNGPAGVAGATPGPTNVAGAQGQAPQGPNVSFGQPTGPATGSTGADQAPPPNNGIVVGSGAGTGDPSNGGAAAPQQQPPGGTCAGQCRDAWRSCNSPCRSQAQCVARCDDTYRDCMRGCY